MMRHARAFVMLIGNLKYQKVITMFDEFDETIPQAEIRVLDEKEKSKFVKRRAQNFPVVDTVEDFMKAILKAFPDLQSESLPSFQFGYVGDKNKKYSISTVLELKQGYDNAMNGNPFWIDIFQSTKHQVNVTRGYIFYLLFSLRKKA